MPDPTIITLGCRLNVFETEVMRHHAQAAGLEDAVIVNTCAVTTEAVRRAKQTVRKVRRDRPTAKIIVTGCAAQVDPAAFAAMAEVDHVIGNAEKTRLETFEGLALDRIERVKVDDIMSITETASHLLDGFSEKTRAFVQVQNGCNHRCTFCIIPYGRGPSRSVPVGEVVAQTRRLVEAGYQEVVLTGVDLTSYGADLPGSTTLGRLVRQILRHVPELERLRLSSIDQVEADKHLLDAIGEEARLMPHLHLSLQSGDDMILKRMKRRHSSSDAVRFCEQVRRLRPDVAFGADLIAGFPTETEAMFDNSLRHVDECGLVFLHVFPYSARPGTPAARMPKVAPQDVKARAARLHSRGRQILAAFLDGHVGRSVQVHMERNGSGHTPQFAKARVHGVTSNHLTLEAMVSGHDGRQLMAEAVA